MAWALQISKWAEAVATFIFLRIQLRKSAGNISRKRLADLYTRTQKDRERERKRDFGVR